jgi:hypothetical protein
VSRRRPPKRGEDPEFDRLVDATMKALNSEAGEQVLAEMVDKKISIPDGLAKLAVLSGQYDYRVEF